MRGEEAIKFCVANLSAVKDSAGWAKMKESPDMLNELILAVVASNCANQDDPEDSSTKIYESMSVGMLRNELDEHNLDLDGTREILIQRLQDHESASSPVEE